MVDLDCRKKGLSENEKVHFLSGEKKGVINSPSALGHLNYLAGEW